MENDLKKLVGDGEKIFYEGKPNKKCFVFESIFNPLLPFALIWAIFDFGLIGGVINTTFSSSLGFIIPFFIVHLMPVWIYLGGVLMTSRRYKNTYYIVTDTGVYISGGIINKTFNHKPFAELSHVDMHRGFFDQKFNVGDIVISSSNFTREGSSSLTISSISEYQEVYDIVKKLQKDIYADTMYPNDKRPSENHGYNTEYKG